MGNTALNPSRDPRQTPKLHLQLQQLRDSGLPSDIMTYLRLMRVLPETFDCLVQVLSPHPVFEKKGPRRSQTFVAETPSSLLSFSTGSNEEEMKSRPTSELGVRSGQGALRPEWAHGWCMTDGSQIPLAFKPSKQAHPREYFHGKGQYALNLQLTVLPTSLRFFDLVAG
ncbi:hypothetical protein V8E36_006748 [Tilletia maclaganii]